MATKERSTRKTGACVRDCQSYRVKPAISQRTQLLSLGSIILDCDFRELFVGTFGADISHWSLVISHWEVSSSFVV